MGHCATAAGNCIPSLHKSIVKKTTEHLMKIFYSPQNRRKLTKSKKIEQCYYTVTILNRYLLLLSRIDRISSTLWPLSPQGLDPMKEHIHRAHCYVKLALSSAAVVETVSNAHCTTNPWKDGQAEWARLAQVSIGMVPRQGHQSRY